MLDDENIGNYLMKFMNIVQLSAIHFGNDKNFQFLIKNAKQSLLEFKVKTAVKEDDEAEITKQKVDIHMEHKTQYNGTADYEWSLVARTLEGNVKNKLSLNFRRVDNTGEEVRLKIE